MTKARDLASGGFGLVLVKPSSVVNGTDNGKGTVSFSGASSVSLNDVFSSTYTKYRIIINFSNTTANGFKLRLRVSGADMTTTDYNYQNVENNNTSLGGARATSDTSFALSSVGSTGINMYDLLIGQPQQTANTTVIGHILQTQNTIMSNFHTGITSVTTSFTGFTFFPLSGVMTGSVSVYGFNN